MTVETHVHHAGERVRSERETFARKGDAYDRFADRVADIDPVPADSPAGGVVADGGARRLVDERETDRCRAVRRAFGETVRPHSVPDGDDGEPLVETIRAELSAEVAVALAPTTEPDFSPEVKRGVLQEARAREREAEAVERALEREAESLATARSLVDELVDWVRAAEETPLSELGFDDLAERHRTLATFRDRCDELVADRQALLRATTGRDPDVAVRHEAVVAFVYADFPVEYPVLSTVARLADTCETCQRPVRDHLVRRA